MKWSERTIAAVLAQQTFNRKYLVVVPNCNWTGYEADILAVTENLRLVDVEIKISRADLKADAKKEKWWDRERIGEWPWVTEWRRSSISNDLIETCARRNGRFKSTHLDWPRRVWKHYYALPAEIWTDDLLSSLGSAASGVLLLTEDAAGLRISCRRPAKPCRDADKLTPAAAVHVARLASLRMWDAYKTVDALRAQQEASHV
ncbi:MAG: hypothetical protein J0I30_00230 [Burkholderiales bacterium]|nr:hypothetical protein [Burkholderiales bacterium]